MHLEPRFDAHAFLKAGHSRHRIASTTADFLARRLAALGYAPLGSDHCDPGPRFIAELEAAPATRKLVEDLWSNLAASDLAPLHGLFRAAPERHTTTVIRMGDGYALDWHNHLAAGPTATVLVYLFDKGDPGTEGDLVLGELGPDLATVVETERLAIAHGDVVIIGDTSHPLLMHRADRWHGTGWRYLIAYGFNAQDW